MRNRLIPSARDTAVFARSIASWTARHAAPLLPPGERLFVQGDQRGDVRPPVADDNALGDQPVLPHPFLQHQRRHEHIAAWPRQDAFPVVD
jgi:hypothetical protein